MDFVRSRFGKMKLWPVEHFWLTFFPDQCWFSADLEKKWAKSVQLVRVSFFRSDFLQNPYFRSFSPNPNIVTKKMTWKFWIYLAIFVTSAFLHFTNDKTEVMLVFLSKMSLLDVLNGDKTEISYLVNVENYYYSCFCCLVRQNNLIV